MTIEVRQMLIKSTVSGGPTPTQTEAVPGASLDRLREEILAECKAWMTEKLQQARGR